MRLFTIIAILIFATATGAKQLSAQDKKGIFFGRVSRINEKAKMVRVRVSFDNVRFLNKKDRTQFWLHPFHKKRCEATVVGKTNDYLLLKVPRIVSCRNGMAFSVGSYVRFYSEDLARNMDVAKDLVGLLLKKRLGTNALLGRSKRELEGYVERVEAVNRRYEALRSQLELEWQKDLTLLEADKATSVRNFNDLQIRLGDIDHKLEQYHIQDTNLKYDRWSLDPRLFTKK